MSRFKKGDVVIVKHSDFNERELIGLVRKVVLTTNDGHVQLDKTLHKKYAYDYLYIQERFKKLEDNAMNRLLYPEVFNA
jgi:hypothetical protein